MDSLTGAGLSPQAVEGVATRLCDLGVIQLEPSTDAFQPHPEFTGRYKLDKCCSSAALTLKTSLDEMHQHAAVLSTANSRRRAELLALIDSNILRASKVLGADFGPASSHPAVENAFFCHPVGPIGSAVRAILAEVAEALEPTIELSPQYLALREFYVDLYGVEGTCYDVMDFICRAAAVLSRMNVSPRRREIPCCSAVNRPAIPLTVFMQLIGEDKDLATVKDVVAVINRVYAGCGWLSARHGMGEYPFHQALREALRSWLITLASPAEPIDILLSGDCNPLQAHPRVTDRVLTCPLEPCLEGGALSLRDARLRYNARSGLIEMLAGKTLVRPFYLGTTFPNPTWGPVYWLILLTMPWCLRPSSNICYEESTPGVSCSPRRSTGRIVIERASWLMSSERLRKVWFRNDGSKRMADIATDCSKLGIPRLFFVRPSPSSGSEKARRHKPMWVDSRNPFILDLLWALLKDADRLLITEALPDRPRWMMLGGLPHTTELHVELAL
jgi:hypothetical protein